MAFRNCRSIIFSIRVNIVHKVGRMLGQTPQFVVSVGIVDGALVNSDVSTGCSKAGSSRVQARDPVHLEVAEVVHVAHDVGTQTVPNTVGVGDASIIPASSSPIFAVDATLS